MKIHLQRYIAELSAEIERIEKLETALKERDLRIKNLEDANNELAKELADKRQRVNEQNNIIINRDCTIRLLHDEINSIRKDQKKKPIHYWEVTVKLPDGRLGTYSITDWPHHIKADEVFRPDITLSLHRVVR